MEGVEKKLSALESIFKLYLDGKTARVHSGGLYVQGGMEQECLLTYKPYQGLILSTELKWNTSEFHPKFVKNLYEKRVDLQLRYNDIENVNAVLTEFMEGFHVTCGQIYPYGVKSFILETNKSTSEIHTLKLFFENGSETHLYGIK